MYDLNEMFLFVHVVENQGFAAAGRALGMPKSKISRRIAQLEERLGIRLINRSTRRFSVTDLGQEYYHHCRAMVVEAEAAEELVARRHSEPCGTIKISCPTSLLDYWVGAMLSRFMLRYPRVNLQIESTNRKVDVIHEGIDIAIRVRMSPLEDSDLVVKRLGNSRQMLVASPALIDGRNMTPAALSELPALHWGWGQSDYSWRLQGPNSATAQISFQPRIVTDNLSLLCQAAVAGLGVVHLPYVVARSALASGQLVDVLPQWHPSSGLIHAAYPSRRGLLPAVKTLLDFLGEEFQHSDLM